MPGNGYDSANDGKSGGEQDRPVEPIT
jgi:hypothetical protein